jgi:signal transduction histidine kinase
LHASCRALRWNNAKENMTVLLNRKIIISLCLIVVIPILTVLYLTFYPTGFPSSATLIALLVGFICVLGMVIMLGVLRALRRIYQSINKMARGDSSCSLPVNDSSGISDLAVSINQLSQKLRDTMDELEKRAILIDRSNQELKRISQHRSDYVAHIVHELRSPLISIEKSSQLMIEQDAAIQAPERANLLRIVNTSAHRLYRLINDILDLAKMESGSLCLEKQSVEIGVLIEEAVNTLASWSGSRNISVDVEQISNLPGVTVDKDRIIQVLVNLLSNAIKFTPSGGRIRINARMDSAAGAPAGIRVSVEDSGPGIPEVDRGRIFERYVSSRGKTESIPNTGLGLSIAKHIVEMHGGKIWVEKGERAGSVFCFTIPLAVAGRASGGTAGDTKKNILIVDDEESVRELLSQELRKRGYAITLASDGLEALKTALDTPYDLVITDIRMPHIDGIRCFEVIRSVMPQTPFIFMTGFAVNPGLEDIGRKGFPCVHKPFDLPTVLSTVEASLRK